MNNQEKTERLKRDCFGNVIEVGDWAVYKNNQTKGNRDWFEVGVVTKICENLIALESFVGDVQSQNYGELMREIHKIPEHIFLFKKCRLPEQVFLEVGAEYD